MKTPVPRNCYSPRLSVPSAPGHTPAQQQFREDCDINTIMQRAQKTGAIDHTSKHQTEYGFASPLNYHDSMNLITKADSMFHDLPSSLRNEFHNNPQAFLEFVQDPKNSAKAKKLGISLSLEAQAIADASTPELVDPAKPDEEPKAAEGPADEGKDEKS